MPRQRVLLVVFATCSLLTRALADPPAPIELPFSADVQTNEQLWSRQRSYRDVVQQILQRAATATEREVSEIRQLHKRGRTYSRTDPLLDTALGIYLAQAGDLPGARKSFETALRSPDYTFPPAAEMYFYYSIALNKFDDVATMMPVYARGLSTKTQPWLPAAQRQEAALWLGRLAGYLVKGPVTFSAENQLQLMSLADQKTTAQIAPDLLEFYEQGRRDVADEFHRRQSANLASPEKNGADVAAPNKTSLRQQADQLATAKQAIDQQKEQAAAQYRDEMRQMTQQLEQLKATHLRNQGTINQAKNRLGTAGSEFARDQLLNTMANLELQNFQVRQQMDQLGVRAQQLTAEYERVSGNVVRNEVALNQQNNRLKKQMKTDLQVEASNLDQYLPVSPEDYSVKLLQNYK